MRYLVTGGCGFIGSHLCDALIAQGDEVVILDNLSTGKRENAPAKAKIVVGDITNEQQVAELMKDVDGCFHLAAIASVELSKTQWQYTHAVNLTGTINVFTAAAKANKKVPVVYASSAAVYGDNLNTPLKESEAHKPLSAYGADKAGCELHAKTASHVHGVPTTGMRFFNVYGPRQDPHSPYSGVISIFSNKISNGEEVLVYGDGSQCRDFIYVADVVSALIAAMSKCDTNANVFNVCTEQTTTVNTLAETIAKMTRQPLRRKNMPAREGDIHTSLGDASHIRSTLGWKHSVSFTEGLSYTLESLKKELAA